MDNERAKTHLSRLGVNNATVARLEEIADRDGMTLREMVRYVLGDYIRHEPRDEEEA